MRSIRSRLLCGLTLVTAATFAVAAWTTFVLARRAMLDEFDALLGAKARTLAMLAEPSPNGVTFEFEEHNLVDFSAAFEPEYYEAWDDAGKVIADSGHASKLPREGPGTLDEPRCRFVTLPDGRPGRMIAVRFLPVAEEAAPPRTGADWVTLIVARDTEQMDEALVRLAWTLAGAFAIAAAALVGLLGGIVLASLKPLETVAGRITRIGESDFASRLPTTDVPTEMVPVIDSFNGMMSRLEAAFDRERTFSSDVAHELRTPLAGLLATIQVALSRSRASGEYRESLVRCEQISLDAHQLVETLLTLSRIEAGLVRPNPTRVALRPLIEAAWGSVAERAEFKGLAFAPSNCRDVLVSVDRDHMSIVLANLFENAVEYTHPGGSVEYACSSSDDGCVLQLANGPCDLSARDLPHIFERFWRGDQARCNTGTHAGLGLALSRRILESGGGALDANLVGDRFVMTLTLKGSVSCPPSSETSQEIRESALVVP